MNKIYFRYGTMFAGKSAMLISAASTYKHNNQKILAFKHSKDTRDNNIIKSRMCKDTLDCITFNDNHDLLQVVKCAIQLNNFIPDIIFIDEIQFCSNKHIDSLVEISKICPIICYGLKNSYNGELFPAIQKLLVIAEDIAEIKNVCSMCKSKATFNLLLRDGKPVYDGNSINIEGENINEEYRAVCRKHYFSPVLNGGE